MAKLSAHGTEVARIKTVMTVPDYEFEVTYSVRSDGHVLRKTAGGGWKLWKRYNGKATMAAVAAEFAASLARRPDTDVIDTKGIPA